MVFYTDIIVQLRGSFPGEGPFPLDVEIAAFAKRAADALVDSRQEARCADRQPR